MHRDDGIILVNVLVALALGSALVVLMFTSQDNLIDRTRRASAAAQAKALALGGEASAVAALTRDMITAPDADHFQEDWAAIQQARVQLETGTFSLAITDAQSRYDINQLQDAGLIQAQTLSLLVGQAGLSASVAQSIVGQVQTDGPLASLDELRDIEPEAIEKLRTLIVALPVQGAVNLNTAPQPVLATVLGNPAVAARLSRLRDRQGFVTPSDLAAIAVVPSGDVGFTSDVYDVTVSAEVDDVTVTLTSRILRLHRTPAEREVRVISRRFGGTMDAAPAN